jgi:hypothetical protein
VRGRGHKGGETKKVNLKCGSIVAVVEVGGGVRIAIDAIKRSKQRDVAVQSSIVRFKKDKGRVLRGCGR